MRVGFLVPLFLNYGCKGIRQPQETFNCRLIAFNVTFFTLAISNCVVSTVFWYAPYQVWVQLLPNIFMGIICIYSVRKIGKEIKSIGLGEHYKAHELVCLVTTLWTFYLVSLTAAITNLILLRAIEAY